MVCSYISRRRRVGWFVVRYPEGEGLYKLEHSLEKTRIHLVSGVLSFKTINNLQYLRF